MTKSTIKPPNKVVLALLETELPSHLQNYYEGIDESGGEVPNGWESHWIPRKGYDAPLPSLHCLLGKGDIQQRSMRNQSTL